MDAHRKRQQSHLAMLAFSALVAGSFALGVRIANDITPAALMILRFAIAAGALAVVVVALGKTHQLRVRAPWRFIVLGGVLSFYFILMFEGLKTATSLSSAAVFTLAPLMSGGFGYLLLRQRASRWDLVALIIGAIGALWVIFQGELSRLLALDIGRGEAIFLVGVVAHAFYTPLVKRLNRGEPPLAMTLYTTLGGLLVLLAYGLRDLVGTELTSLSTQVWGTVLYLAIATSAGTFFLVQFATLHLPSANVMAYTYLVPSWVILWELSMGGAGAQARVLVGVGFTIVALVMLLRTRA